MEEMIKEILYILRFFAFIVKIYLALTALAVAIFIFSFFYNQHQKQEEVNRINQHNRDIYDSYQH